MGEYLNKTAWMELGDGVDVGRIAERMGGWGGDGGEEYSVEKNTEEKICYKTRLTNYS